MTVQNASTPSETSQPRVRSRLFRRLRRVLIVLVILGLLFGIALSPAFFIGTVPPDWSPEWLTNYAYDVRLAIGPLAKAGSSFIQGSFSDDRVRFDRAGERVRFDSEGLSLAGTLYAPETDDALPGVVLVHGSTPEGRTMGMYRILGDELSRRGYTVLTIDLRGYGASENQQGRTVEAFNYVADVMAAVDYLLQLESVDPEQIYVIGHSFGADVAISGGVADDRVQRIVAIGPARQLEDRAEEELDYFRRRDMRYMLSATPISRELFLSYRVPLIIDSHVDYFTSDDHKPILLLDGALENATDRAFLKELYDEMTEPKSYVTLENADHYANIASVGPFIFYDTRVLDDLVNTIDTWLTSDIESE